MVESKASSSVPDAATLELKPSFASSQKDLDDPDKTDTDEENEVNSPSQPAISVDGGVKKSNGKESQSPRFFSRKHGKDVESDKNIEVEKPANKQQKTSL